VIDSSFAHHGSSSGFLSEGKRYQNTILLYCLIAAERLFVPLQVLVLVLVAGIGLVFL
jgi:hypothetical protein